MTNNVAIIGVGATQFRSISPDVNYREMIYNAAVKAYADAGIEASEVESFVSCTEDMIEGISIADEYCPDQVGAATKPVHTISGDGIQGISSAYMLIKSGLFDIMVVEAHSKISNVDDVDAVLAYGMDPIFHRDLGLPPHAIAGMEMRRFLHESGIKGSDCASVVAQNRKNALKNPLASNGGQISAEEVLASNEVFSPLREAEVAPHADGAIVIVLASEKRAGSRPVWVNGISWASDTWALETRDWGNARYAADAAKRAYSMAGLSEKSIDLAEVDDTYAYKQLQHLKALGLSGNGVAVNVSGGIIGCGNLGEANGSVRVLECVQQIRGEAGARQLNKVQNTLAMAWRGVPASTGSVVILGR